MDYDDPGWRHALKNAVWPYSMPFRSRAKSANQLIAARMIYVGIGIALLLFAFVISQILPSTRWFKGSNRAWFLVIVVAIGIVCLLRIARIRGKPLDVSSSQRLVDSYRAMFFIGLGYAQAPALSGFVGAFVMDNLWIYLIGLVFSMIAMALIAPSKREIARRQAQIAAQGSSLSLGAILVEPPSQAPKHL